MNIEISRNRDTLLISLAGELDHHAAKEVFESFSSLASALPHRCELDMNSVSFMDSSGIAVVLGLKRRLGYIGSVLTVKNIAPQAMRVFKAAGVDRLVSLQSK